MSSAKIRRIWRISVSVAVALLAAVLLVQALVVLVEALAVLGLVVILGFLALPRDMGHYWRKLRAELPLWLEKWAGQVRGFNAPEAK